MNGGPRRTASGLCRSATGLACLAACGHASPAVPNVPQPDFAPLQVVPFAPPVAQVEYLSEAAPAPDCGWVDGQWVWGDQHWNWQPGSWIVPPEGCRHSAPILHWAMTQGAPTLYYRPGRWYSLSQPKACPDPLPCPSRHPPAAATPTAPSSPATATKKP
jgi:hypothetical protein